MLEKDKTKKVKIIIKVISNESEAQDRSDKDTSGYIISVWEVGST